MKLSQVMKSILVESNYNPNNLKFGDRDSDVNGPVHQLQKKLMDSGFLKTTSMKPTGYFGRLTNAALSKATGNVTSNPVVSNNVKSSPSQSNGKFKAVLVAGMTFGESVEQQVDRLRKAIGGNVKGFSYTGGPQPVIDFLKNNPQTPVFLFSAGCSMSGDIANCGYVDKNKFYIVEPYFSGGKTTSQVRSAVTNGVPASHVFVGPSAGRGLGIVKGATDSRTPQGCHYCSVSTVGQMVVGLLN